MPHHQAAEPVLNKPYHKKRRHLFSQGQTDKLNAWFNGNTQNQRGNTEDKQKLCDSTGLTPRQITNWASHRRKSRQKDKESPQPGSGNLAKTPSVSLRQPWNHGLINTGTTQQQTSQPYGLTSVPELQSCPAQQESMMVHPSPSKTVVTTPKWSLEGWEGDQISWPVQAQPQTRQPRHLCLHSQPNPLAQTTYFPDATAPTMIPPLPRSSSSVFASAQIRSAPISYPANPPVQRRQLSASSMPRCGGRNSAYHTQHDTQPLMGPQQSTHSTSWASQPPTQPNTARPVSTKMHLPRLLSVMTDPQTRDSFKGLASQRMILLEQACRNEDWFYLMFHQLLCWRSMNRRVMPLLDFINIRHRALADLEVMLVLNDNLDKSALEWFSHFPTNPEDVLRKTSLEAMTALSQIQAFLEKMDTDWSPLSTSCLARKYPPIPCELYVRLALPSTVLQNVFFNVVFQQIEGTDNGSWLFHGTQLFELRQSELVGKVNRIHWGFPEALPNMDRSCAQFASDYFELRNTYASRPVKPRTTNTTTPYVRPTSPVVSVASNLPPPPLARLTTPSPYRAPADGSHARLSSSPSGRSGVSPHVNSGVVTHIPQLSLSQPQPTPSNNGYTNPTMGPRLQDYVQELTPIPAMPDVWLADMDDRATSSSNSSLLSPTVMSDLEIGRLHTPLANGYPACPKPTPFLPPAGKQLQLNTHTNPNNVGLHQARQHRPEPPIFSLEEHVQTSPRLFPVLQRFVLAPELVTKEQTNYKWHIVISAPDASRKATDDPILGSVAYWFRCVMRPKASLCAPPESEWATEVTNFPGTCSVSLNMSEIPIRRKSQSGKVLAYNLTPGIKTGLNTIEMSVHLSAEEESRTFVVAVEQIEIFDQLRCTQQLTLIERPVSLAAIVASLTPANDDDDIAILDPHISIDLIDPFTARICRAPVRGSTCTHRECFDLQAFLESRQNIVKGVPLESADEWKCPICNNDARPQSLLLDGFLLDVCKHVGSRRKEVKAIQVSGDGTWKWRVEREDSERLLGSGGNENRERAIIDLD